MVALIFRHIATYPEILEEVWTSIGPLFRGGRIQDAAWRIAKLVSLAEPLPRLEPDTRDVLGLAGDDLERIQNTLDAYNRANPVNLLAILSLLARVQTDAPAVAPQERDDWPPPWLVNYEDGLAKYRQRDFASAIKSFKAVLSMRPHDGPAALMVDRCRSLIQSGTDDTWSSVATQNSK
jgi:hypothetical protein